MTRLPQPPGTRPATITRAGGLLILALLVVACSSAGGSTKPPAGACVRTDASNAVGLTANNLQFSTACIEAVVGENIVIHFTNEEAAPHDVAVYKDSSKTQELGRSDIVTGPNAATTLTLPQQPPGHYYFECTIHTAMNGSLVVRGEAPAP